MNKNKHTLKEIFFTAVANYKKKDFKTAEITCYKILNIDPNHFDSLSLLASISAINQNYKSAKDLLFKAIEIQPKNVTILNNLGTACKELGEFKEAIKFYKGTAELTKDAIKGTYDAVTSETAKKASFSLDFIFLRAYTIHVKVVELCRFQFRTP